MKHLETRKHMPQSINENHVKIFILHKETNNKVNHNFDQAYYKTCS